MTIKLSTDSVSQLDQLIQTATLADLVKLVIEPGKIRGINKNQTVVVFSDNGVPDMQGLQVGINRVSELGARLNLIKSQGTAVVAVTPSTHTPNDISMMELSSGRTKAQFRTASVDAVKGVPKNITDTVAWQVTIDSRLITTIVQGVAATKAENITIASRDGQTVTFETVDANKDIFATDAEDHAVWVGQGTPGTSFVQTYQAKTLLALLREANKSGGKTMVNVGAGGLLSLVVNGLDFYFVPTN